MIKLNRTTEYGLMALRHMSRKKNSDPAPDSLGVTSAREISDTCGIPFEITAKTLQRLKDTGLIQSSQGSRGGYTLQRLLREVSLAEFLQLMEGPQAVVACAGVTSPSAPSESCNYEVHCEIRHLMGDLNLRVQKFLGGIPLADLIEDPVRLSFPHASSPAIFAASGCATGTPAVSLTEEP